MLTLIQNSNKFSEEVIYKYMKENYVYYYDSGTGLIDVTNLAEATALFLDDYDENLMIHEIYFRVAVKVAQEEELEQELLKQFSNIWSETIRTLENHEKENKKYEYQSE